MHAGARAGSWRGLRKKEAQSSPPGESSGRASFRTSARRNFRGGSAAAGACSQAAAAAARAAQAQTGDQAPEETAAAAACHDAGPATAPASPPANNTVAVAHPPANPAPETPPPDKAIAADVSSAQLNQQKQTTAQLLETTEKTLGGLNHTLSHDEEEIVTQVRSYVAQSRKATTDGDFERAYNLATKAHLLSDALIKK